MQLSASLALTCLALSLVACSAGASSPSPSAPAPGAGEGAGSGSGDSSDNGSQSSNGGAATTDPHVASEQALLDELDTETDPQAIIAFAKKLPDVADATLASDGDSITVHFSDLIPLIIKLTTDPRAGLGDPPSTALPSPSVADPIPQGIPSGGTMLLLNALDPSYGDPAGEISKIAAKSGYAVKTGTLSLDELATPSLFTDASVVYMSTHGGNYDFRGLTKEFNLQTSTCVLKNELRPPYPMYEGTDDKPILPEVVRIIQKDATDLPAGCLESSTKGHAEVYGVTRAFFDNHVQFRANETFFIADACLSDTSDAQSFKATIGKKGAALYGGWSDTTTDPGRVAPYLLDRMAGANTYDGPGNYAKESPPQRPFTATTIMNDMKSRGLDTAPNKAKFAITPFAAASSDTDFGLLAPVITMITPFTSTPQSMSGQLTQIAVTASAKVIAGDGTPAFTWGGNPVDIDHVISQETSIGTVTVFILNISANAAGGDLAMTINKHESNHVRISEYRGVMKASSGNDSFTDTFVVNYHALAFAQTLRQAPHVAPIRYAWGTFYLPDSTVTFTPGAPTQGDCSRTLGVAATLPLSQWVQLPGVGMGFDPEDTNTELQFNLINQQGVLVICPNVAPELSFASAMTSDFEGSDKLLSTDWSTLVINAGASLFTNGPDSLSIQPFTMEPIVGPAPDNAR